MSCSTALQRRRAYRRKVRCSKVPASARRKATPGVAAVPASSPELLPLRFLCCPSFAGVADARHGQTSRLRPRPVLPEAMRTAGLAHDLERSGCGCHRQRADACIHDCPPSSTHRRRSRLPLAQQPGRRWTQESLALAAISWRVSRCNEHMGGAPLHDAGFQGRSAGRTSASPRSMPLCKLGREARGVSARPGVGNCPPAPAFHGSSRHAA